MINFELATTKFENMYLYATCANIQLSEWNALMKKAKKFSYKKLCKLIQEEIPELYNDLALQFPNPYDYKTMQTETHYILVHSAVEYFICK